MKYVAFIRHTVAIVFFEQICCFFVLLDYFERNLWFWDFEVMSWTSQILSSNNFSKTLLSICSFLTEIHVTHHRVSSFYFSSLCIFRLRALHRRKAFVNFWRHETFSAQSRSALSIFSSLPLSHSNRTRHPHCSEQISRTGALLAHE